MTFTHKVAMGKNVPNQRTIAMPMPYRVTEPIIPPIATANNSRMWSWFGFVPGASEEKTKGGQKEGKRKAEGKGFETLNRLPGA